MDPAGEVCCCLFVVFLVLRHWTSDIRQYGVLGFCSALSGVHALLLGGALVWLGLGVTISSMLLLFLDALESKRGL